MNIVHIIGNLTANPESRVVQGANGENTVCNFTVAVNRLAKGQKVADYFRVTVWNRQAENAMKYLAKGRQVAVTGTVTGQAYISREGQARCSLEIIDVRELQYLGGRQESGAAPAGQAEPAGQTMAGGYTQVDLDDSELPF